MIKCIGFLRSLKQLLSILLISCFIFGLGSSVNATFQTVGLARQQSSINSNYNLGFLRGGGVITDYLGTSKGILAIDTDKLFWWYPDGRPYFYSPSWQGFFTYYDSCPEIIYSGNDFVFNQSSCTRVLLTGDYKTFFTNFFKQVKDDDFVYYTYSNTTAGNQCTVRNQSTIFCWSSREIGRSICFDYANCYNGCSVATLKCGNGIDNGGGFTDSLNYNNLTFGIIPYSDIGQAPGTAGYAGGGASEGSSDTVINVGLTGDYSYSTCTQGEILDMLENQGFNKFMCFGGLDNFDLWSSTGSYSPVPGYGKRLSQILSYSNAWDSPQDWFEYWNGLYQDKDNPLYYSMWESYPAVYRTWFDMYYKYGNNKYFDSIREYCVMKVDLSLNPDLVYKGTQFKGVCDTIIDVKQNPQYYTTDSGGRIVGVNWVGVGKLSGDNKNAVQFIQDFFNTVKVGISTNYDGPGFLPSYIILFLLALIFFRFISH